MSDSHRFYFEDFTEGRHFTTKPRTVRESDLATFLGLTGMYEEIFMNPSVEGSVLPPNTVPGMLVISLAEGLVVLEGLMEHGRAFLGLDELRLEHPVAVGDRIHCEVEVTSARRSKTRHAGIVTLRQAVLVANASEPPVMCVRYSTTRMIGARPA